jgi:hypothetical protein
MSPAHAFELIAEKAQVEISKFNFFKFYALSKSTDTSDFKNLNQEEFLELVFRISDYIYNKESWDES